jgi:hypothetical protein
MKSKLHIILSQNGYISTEETTPRDEVEEFVKTAPLTINDWTQIRKEVRNIVNEYLKQFPHIKRSRPTGDGTTVTILKSEYDGMKNTIAAQAARIEEQDKIIAAQAARIEILEKENSDLKRVVETLIHRIEILEARN